MPKLIHVVCGAVHVEGCSYFVVHPCYSLNLEPLRVVDSRTYVEGGVIYIMASVCSAEWVLFTGCLQLGDFAFQDSGGCHACVE